MQKTTCQNVSAAQKCIFTESVLNPNRKRMAKMAQFYSR